MKTRKKISKKMKKLISKRIGSSRKKGAILIEFIVALPVFIFMLWGIMNLMLYLLASSTVNEAAYEAARGIVVEMRGDETTVVDPDKHVGHIADKVASVARTNNFVLLYKEGHVPNYYYTKADCQAAKERKERDMFCAYVEEFTPQDTLKVHQQVVVHLRSGFNMIGGFIQGLQSKIGINGVAVAQKELPGRANYIEVESGG